MERQLLFIGIGQTGCTVAGHFSQKMPQDGGSVRVLSLDTDESVLSLEDTVSVVSLADARPVGGVVEALGADSLSPWFPCDWDADGSGIVRCMDMHRGAGLWRTKALLSFAAFLNDPEKVQQLHSQLDGLDGEVDLCIVASLAGGTGAGLFLPVALYVKQYIRSLGGRVASARAVLTMPDVYEGQMTAEQITKSRANAYAALRELQALYLAIWPQPDTPPVDLYIGGDRTGSPDRPVALPCLFDSQDESFCRAEYAPFDQVLLFERIPGVRTVDLQVDILAETLATLCRCEAGEMPAHDLTPSKAVLDTAPQTMPTPDVYGSISLTKVIYPVDSLIQYMTARQIYRFASAETADLHETVTKKARQMQAYARRQGLPLPDDLTLYCQTFATEVGEIMANTGSGDALIGRYTRPEMTASASVSQATWDDELLGDYKDGLPMALREYVQQILNCPASDALLADLDAHCNVRLDAKGRPVKLPRESAEEVSDRYREQLTAYYRHGLSLLTEGAEALFDAFLSGGESGGFSLLEDVLKEEGQYLHPTHALTRLCLLYQAMDVAAGQTPVPEVEMSATVTLPRRLLILPEHDLCMGRSAYAKAGEERLALCLLGEEGDATDAPDGADDADAPKTNKHRQKKAQRAAKAMMAVKAHMLDDGSLFYEDANQVFSAIKRGMMRWCYRRLMEPLGRVIANYRRWLELVSHDRADLWTEVGIRAVADSEGRGSIIPVGASVVEKQELYEAYEKRYLKGDTVHAHDVALGEAVSRLCFVTADGPLGLEAYRSLQADLEPLYRAGLVDSDFYRERLDKNIIEAMDGSAARMGYADSGRYFVGRNIPLATSAPTHASQRAGMRESVTAVLAPEVEAYLAGCPDMTRGKSPAAHIADRMYDAGEYRGRVVFAPDVSPRVMYVQKTVSGSPLSLVDAVNEYRDGLCYTAYCRAGAVASVQKTHLWDSHLLCRRDHPPRLPFIAPETQSRWCDTVSKAVLYAFAKEEIFLARTEDHDRAYVLQEGLDIRLLEIDGEGTPAAWPHEVMRWAYAHPDWAERQAGKYEALFLRTLFPLPPHSADGDRCRRLATTAGNAQAIRLLESTVARFLADLLQSHANGVYVYAAGMVRVAEATLYRYCLGGEPTLGEVSVCVLNEWLRSFRQSLVREAEGQPTSLAAWAESADAFHAVYLPGEDTPSKTPDPA